MLGNTMVRAMWIAWGLLLICLIVFVANVSLAQSDIAGTMETRRVLAEHYAALSLPLMPNGIEETSAES